MEVTAMIGRQLPFFSLLVPFWLIWAFAGRKAMWKSGLPFWSPVCRLPFRSTWSPTSSAPSWWTSLRPSCRWSSLIAFLRVWQPKKIWTSPSMRGHDSSAAEAKPQPLRPLHKTAQLVKPGHPGLILTVFVFVWGCHRSKPSTASFAPKFPDGRPAQPDHERCLPWCPHPTPKSAVYTLNLLSATGTGILLAAILGALMMKYKPMEIVRTFGRTFWLVRYSLLTIVLMLGLGTLDTLLRH
jgi:lactate permease